MQKGRFQLRYDTAYAFILIALILGGSAVWITSEISKPKLTDPIAQRIWAAGHSDVSMGSEAMTRVIKEATLADSVNQKKKSE